MCIDIQTTMDVHLKTTMSILWYEDSWHNQMRQFHDRVVFMIAENNSHSTQNKSTLTGFS